MQFSLFDSDITDTNQPDSSVKTLPLAEADVKYYPRAIATDSANHYFHALKQELPWRQDAIRLLVSRLIYLAFKAGMATQNALTPIQT